MQKDSTQHFSPAPGGPVRVGQLVRDRKFRREGVPEDVFPAPHEFVLPLLFGKLHAEIAEMADNPHDAAEHADVADLLDEIAARGGHDLGKIGEAARANVAARRDEEEEEDYEDLPRVAELVSWLHRAVARMSRDMGEVEHHVTASELALRIAANMGVKEQSVAAARTSKADEFGGFALGTFWQPAADARAFTPELGQMVQGQQSFSYAVPAIMVATLDRISESYASVYFNVHQKRPEMPFGNNGTRLETDVFKVQAYSWDEEAEQDFNFAWRDLKVRWYKHSHRGLSSNMPITAAMASQCLEECLAAIDAMENDRDDEDHTNFVDLT